MSFLPFLILWGLMAASVIALILWRRAVAGEEDDSIHVMEGEQGVTQHQVVVAQKLETIDKWGKALTAATVLVGVVIAGVYFYHLWVATSTTIPE